MDTSGNQSIRSSNETSVSTNAPQLSLQYKYVITIAIFVCYFSNAINFYLLAPTLLELMAVMDTSVDVISNIYTIRSATYTFGALSGFAFNYINRQICLIIFTLIMGISLALMPISSSIAVFFSVGAVNGFMAGGGDTAINVWIMEMWSENSGPHLQALHFAFGCGSVVAPLIAQPFLSDSNQLPTDAKSKLFIAYIICGSISVFGAIVLLVLYFYRKYKPDQQSCAVEPTRSQSISDDIVDQSERYQLTRISALVIVILGILLLATYVAMEMTQFSFQPTFVYFSSNMSETEAASLASTTAAAFTITRGLGIIAALKFSSHAILLCHFTIIIFANIVILFTYTLSSMWMWIANIVIGIGCSSVYPTIYAFLQNTFNIDNKKASIFLFVGGASSAIYPFIVGRFIESQPLILIYLNLASITFCVVILFAIRVIMKNYKNMYSIQHS